MQKINKSQELENHCQIFYYFFFVIVFNVSYSGSIASYTPKLALVQRRYLFAIFVVHLALLRQYRRYSRLSLFLRNLSKVGDVLYSLDCKRDLKKNDLY